MGALGLRESVPNLEEWQVNTRIGQVVELAGNPPWLSGDREDSMRTATTFRGIRSYHSQKDSRLEHHGAALCNWSLPRI
jgi:hypothetical protein